MSLKIVIPSHKRHDRVLAKKLVKDPIICVAKSQEEIYRHYNPECEIVTHPDDIIGLVPKRNWMARHFGELMMLDDDVHVVKNLMAEKGETGTVRDPEKITAIIEDLYELACLLDVHVFGFTSAISPMMYDEYEYFSLSKMITGCSYGVRYNKNVWWNEELKLKEDFWISCYMKYKERKILTDLRYNFSQKGTFVSAGGLASIRNHDEEQRSILLIRKNFGESVVLKGTANNGKEKIRERIQHNIVCRFKY